MILLSLFAEGWIIRFLSTFYLRPYRTHHLPPRLAVQADLWAQCDLSNNLAVIGASRYQNNLEGLTGAFHSLAKAEVAFGFLILSLYV